MVDSPSERFHQAEKLNQREEFCELGEDSGLVILQSSDSEGESSVLITLGTLLCIRKKLKTFLNQPFSEEASLVRYVVYWIIKTMVTEEDSPADSKTLDSIETK